MLADIPSIVLAVINLILVKNAFGTLEYEYQPTERNFLPHISKLVSSAFFYDLERAFVWYLRIFPWRINASEDFKR